MEGSTFIERSRSVARRNAIGYLLLGVFTASHFYALNIYFILDILR